MADQAVAEPPPVPLQQTHIESAKAIFNKAKAEAGDQPVPVSSDVVEVTKPAPPKEPAPAPEATPPPAEPPKSGIPDDVISPPSPEQPKPDEAIAAIDAMQLPKGAKPEVVKNFAEFREKVKGKIQSQETKIRELEEKIGQTTNKAELEALQAKLAAAEEKAAKIEEDFSRVAFEQSPRFRSKFVDREKAALETAKTFLEGTEVKPEIIDVAARVSGKKRLEILRDAGIEGDMLAAIVPYLAGFDAVQREKSAALDNWKGESARWQEENVAKTEAAKAQRIANENRVWESVFHKTDLLPLRKSKENADWNARAEELAGRAKQIFNGEGVPLDTFAETIQKGVAYDAVNDVLQKILEENKNLKAENTNLKSARPGGAITAGDGAPATPVKQTREDLSKSTFNQELAKAQAG